MWKRTQILQLTPNLEYILQNFFSSSLVFHHKYSTFSIVIGKNKTKYSSFWFTSILSSDLQSKFRTLLLFLSLILLSSSQVFSLAICNSKIIKPYSQYWFAIEFRALLFFLSLLSLSSPIKKTISHG
jgi:hypothetical protein